MPIRELDCLDWKDSQKAEESGEYCWENRTVRMRITGIKGTKQEIRIGSRNNALTIRSEGNRTEISFLDDRGNPAVCGGGRRIRIGRTEEDVDHILIIIDSSIVEIYVNHGETVFTSRIYLEEGERKLAVQGGGTVSVQMI